MRVSIICVLILGFFSHCLCDRLNLVGTNNNIFNVMQYGAHGDGKTDDAQAFLRAWNSTCAAQGSATLVIPANKIFLVTNLLFNGGDCKATSINIKLQGNIVAPSKEAWKDTSHWINIEYINGLTIDGTNTGGLDGHGSTWWPCKTCPRPVVLSFHSCNKLNVNGLRISNSPGAHISINGCDGATFSNVLVNSPGTSPNTDGFDISSSKNILIKDSTIHAGDDCIAINGGSSYINATNVACGPGHGISIGSLGKGKSHEEVEEVHVKNCSFTDTTNGARIKTFPGGSGFARKITFEQIQLTNVKNAIIIDQHYGIKIDAESAVQVSDVTYQGFSGTGAGDLAINLNCESCLNIVLNKISIVPSQPKTQLHTICKNFHGTITSTVPKVTCS
ncbi:unnamed protein product [Trifolium pratense]|uniref:Uncharacterized protein n=1 Tax=Trifolium pratense TaxID=57577 RepID=A0ACB0KBX8_TRIPR|nr:unnamed protein product [Trifolium pratense]